MNNSDSVFTRKKYVFWQHRPSAHQASFIRALADIPGIEEVVLVVKAGLSEERLAQGWNLPDYGKTQVLVEPGHQIIEELVRGENAHETVHVFSFLSRDKAIFEIFNRCYGSGALLGLLSEGRDWRGGKGIARRVHGWLHERCYQTKLDFVLAIGELSKIWYRKNNVSLEKLYDFCYVVEEPSQLSTICKVTNNVVKLIYVGQLIPRKRVDLLIRSLSYTGHKNFTLDIIGTGIEFHELTVLSRSLKLDAQINFLGVLNNSEVSKRLCQADLLILPSDWDGWGAVINEALAVGTPVICSDYCGAADLICTHAGEVFQSGSADSLTDVLRKWLRKGTVKQRERLSIKQYSISFNGVSVAKYLTEIVAFEDNKSLKRPSAPWKLNNISRS